MDTFLLRIISVQTACDGSRHCPMTAAPTTAAAQLALNGVQKTHKEHTMTRPAAKTIGRLTIAVDECGSPRWTRITDDQRNHVAILNEEEAHDLHYALSRIVKHLSKGPLS